MFFFYCIILLLGNQKYNLGEKRKIMKKVKKCVIPAAWFGTRFLPATKALPKEMFPIIDKPVMQYLVEEAVEAGCEDIIIITWRNKRAIEDHFDSNFELESALEKSGKIQLLEEVKKINSLANISYVRQPYPRGDGDAILRAKNIIGDEPFLVLFGDDLIFWEVSASRQLIAEYERTGSSVVAAIEVTDEEVSSYGIMESQKYDETFEIQKFLEKPTASQTVSRVAAIGKYVVTPQMLDILWELYKTSKEGELKLADGFAQMLKTQKVLGKKVTWKRFDAGSKTWFIKATIYQALEREDMKQEIQEFIDSLWQ